MIDPSIPLKGLLINRNDEMQKQAQLQAYEMKAQEYQREQQNRSRLADLLPKAAAGDQAALGQVASLDPDIWSKLSTHQQAQLKGNREMILAGAKIIREINPQDEAGWQRALSAAQQAGMNLSGVPGHFDPAFVQNYISIANAMEKDIAPTPMQRNYEFLKGQNPQLADRYLQGQAEGDPIVQRNEDGTMTVYPRSMLSGAQGSAPPPPPPGFVIDGQGGAGGNVSGNFPNGQGF